MRHRSGPAGISDDNELVPMAGAIAILSGRQRPMHHTTLYRGIKAGRFPAPIRIGPGSARWLRSELVAVRDRMIAERDGLMHTQPEPPQSAVDLLDLAHEEGRGEQQAADQVT